MRYQPSFLLVLLLSSTAILVSTGCPGTDGIPHSPDPADQPLNDAIKVVGGTWSTDTLKDTGGPTISPPTVTVRSNSGESFAIEIGGVEAPYTLADVTRLRIASQGLLGSYATEVELDDHTDMGTIRATVVQEDPTVLTGRFSLEIAAVDAQEREGGSVSIDAAFFSASAGEDAVVPVDSEVELNASFTGATGTPLVHWSQVAGSTVVIADPSAAGTSFVPTQAATYVFRLEATDPSGVIDVDLVTIVAVDEFTVDAGTSKVITVGEETELRGLAGGGAGQASFSWTEVSDFNVEIQYPDSRIATFVAPETGEYEFELTATDDLAGEASDRVIHLAVDRLTALADTPPQAELDATVQLQGQAGGGLFPYAFRWSQVSGPAAEIEDATNQTALATLPSAGAYVFELRVEDSTGDDAAASVTIAVDMPSCDVDADCDDGVFCNGAEICDPTLGCLAETDPCPGQLCDETDGVCVDCLDNSLCDDGLFCNGVETCVDGFCQSGTDPCSPGAICDEDSDSCTTPICTTDADCDDGNECTDDTCAGATGECLFTNNTATCDDGDDCTENDACADGVCAGTPIECGEGETCVNGACLQPCVTDAVCDDAQFCNGTETCVGGFCQVGDAPCTSDDTCDEGSDECTPSTDTIHPSEWLTGAIDPVVDQDTYTFSGQAGQQVIIQVNTTSGGLSPWIDLFPPSGGSRETTSNTCRGCTIALLFAHPLAESGQYTIVVRDREADSTGEYIMSLLILSGPLTSVQDEDGGTIAFDEVKIGSIDPVVDMDAYTFTGVAGQRVTVQVNTTSGGLSPWIDLFPPSGGSRETTSNTCRGCAIAQIFAYPLAESGEYTMVVRDREADSTGEYIMSLSVFP